MRDVFPLLLIKLQKIMQIMLWPWSQKIFLVGDWASWLFSMGSLKLLQWNKILLRPQFSAVDICVKAFCRASKLPSFTCNMDQSHFSTQLLTANSYWETQHCALARLYQLPVATQATQQTVLSLLSPNPSSFRTSLLWKCHDITESRGLPKDCKTYTG